MTNQTAPQETAGTNRDAREGSIMFLVMSILAALVFVGASLFLITKTDLKIAANFKSGVEAFQQADAGIQYVKDQIDQDLNMGTLTLDQPVETVNYTAPAGFNFDSVTTLTRTGDTNAYVFEITGRSLESEATIEAVVHRRPSLEFGLFGNEEVDLKAYANIYSYNSAITPNPTAADSNGSADTASNEDFVTRMGTVIDGSLVLGEDTFGNPGIWSSMGTPDISNYEGLEVSRIETDPLGVIGGDLSLEFIDASTTNNNSSAIPPIPSNNKISLNNGDTMTLPAGDYYLESVILKNGATLDIDASAGPVTIYLTGRMEAKNGSSINFHNNPTDFFLFSNSSSDITIKNNAEFNGIIYAPKAFVELKNGGDFYGIIWAESAEIKNSGNFFIDISLMDHFWESSVYLVSWKDVRGD